VPVPVTDTDTDTDTEGIAPTAGTDRTVPVDPRRGGSRRVARRGRRSGRALVVVGGLFLAACAQGTSASAPITATSDAGGASASAASTGSSASADASTSAEASTGSSASDVSPSGPASPTAVSSVPAASTAPSSPSTGSTVSTSPAGGASATPAAPATSATAVRPVPGSRPAHALLAAPALPIGPAADRASAARSKIPAADLHLLGSIPAGARYPVGAVGNEGETPSSTWPDACTMLSNTDIKTLLPKSGAVTRKGQHGAFLGGGETAHFATCDYGIAEPGDTEGQPSSVHLDLRAVGDPRAVLADWKESYASQLKGAAKYPDQFLDWSKGQLGGATCFYDGNEIQCVKAHFDFWVGGLDTGPIESGPNAYFAQKLGYVEQVLANVVATLAARMS